MSRRASEAAAALVFLALFLGVAWLALDFGPRARMIPLPLAIFGAVLALVQIVLHERGLAQGLRMDLIRVERPAGAGDTAGDAAAPPQEILSPGATPVQAYAIVGGLLAMILAIGPVPSVFLFTIGYFVKTRYCTLARALIYATGFTVVVYLLFFVALQIQPYHGVLAPLIAHFD